MSIPRLHAVEADWWAELSPAGRAEYLEEHPNSKKAQEHRELLKKKEDKVTKQEKDAEHDNAKNPKVPALLTKRADKSPEEKKSETEDPKQGKKAIHHRFADALKRLKPKDKEFFEGDEIKPNSKARTAVAKHIKKRSGLLVESLKHQGEEWKTGVKAIHKLMKKQKLTDHDKNAISSLAKDMVVVLGVVALGGGLAHGAVAAARHLGEDVVKDIILKSFAHGIAGRDGQIPHKTAHASVYKSLILELAKNPDKKAVSTDDDLLRQIFEKIADHIQGGHISDKQWGEVIKSMGDGQDGGMDGKKADTKAMKSMKERQDALKSAKKTDPAKKAKAKK